MEPGQRSRSPIPDTRTQCAALLLLAALTLFACGPEAREGEGARVGFAQGYTAVSKAEGPGCEMTTKGIGARKAVLVCLEVEPETVAAMIEAVCEPLKRMGFKRVEYSSEADEGRCSVSRCSCESRSDGAAKVEVRADASVADGGP